MEFALASLKAKKEELFEKYKDLTDRTSIMAYLVMEEQLDKSIELISQSAELIQPTSESRTYYHNGVALEEQFLWKVEYSLSNEEFKRSVHITTKEFSHSAAIQKWAHTTKCTFEISYAGPVLV
jgi:hypothetical protein